MLLQPQESLRTGTGCSGGLDRCRTESLPPPSSHSALELAEQGSFQPRQVVVSPSKLRLHPTLVRLKLVDSVIELNQAIRLQGKSVHNTILITAKGTIISGFREWHEAVSDGRPAIDCVEYSFSDEQALEFILIKHRPRRAWNNFNRVRLALELEPYFQRRALANQIAGGKYKGLANLPKAEHIEVREEIASVAGVSGRTVSNVKTLLEKAATDLKDALNSGVLTINRVLQWCSLPEWKQVEQFRAYIVERATNKVIRQAIGRSPMQGLLPDPGAVLHALRQRETREPGSIEVRAGKGQKTVILIGDDLWSDLKFEME